MNWILGDPCMEKYNPWVIKYQISFSKTWSNCHEQNGGRLLSFFRSGVGLPERLPVSSPPFPSFWCGKSALWSSRSKRAAHPPPPILSGLPVPQHCSSFGAEQLTGCAALSSTSSTVGSFLLSVSWFTLCCARHPSSDVGQSTLQTVSMQTPACQNAPDRRVFFGSCSLMPVWARSTGIPVSVTVSLAAAWPTVLLTLFSQWDAVQSMVEEEIYPSAHPTLCRWILWILSWNNTLLLQTLASCLWCVRSFFSALWSGSD